MAKTDARRRSVVSFAIRLGLVLIVVVAVVYWLLLADLERTLRYRLDHLYARGFPRTWEQAIPPPVPDDENAAILYEQAFDRLNLTSTRNPGVIRDYLRAGSRLARRPFRAATKQLLIRNRRAIELLWEASEKPACRFPIDWRSTAFDFALSAQGFEYPGRLRESSRLLAADALIAAEAGDTERVVRSCRAAIRMYANTLREPTLIYFLTASAMQGLTLRSLRSAVQEVDLDPPACRALYNELGRLAFDTSFRDVAQVEGLQTLALFSAAERTPGRLQGFTGSDNGWFPSNAIRSRFFLSPLGKPWRLKEEIISVDLIEQALSSLDKPLHEGARAYRTAEQDIVHADDHYLLASAAETVFRAAGTRYHDTGRRNGAQVMLALEAYHTSRGAYPDALAALRTYPGWKLPIDPYSGKDFRYRRNRKGYILYSFSDDFDDDGGRPAPHFGLDGDWVWTVER